VAPGTSRLFKVRFNPEVRYVPSTIFTNTKTVIQIGRVSSSRYRFRVFGTGACAIPEVYYDVPGSDDPEIEDGGNPVAATGNLFPSVNVGESVTRNFYIRAATAEATAPLAVVFPIIDGTNASDFEVTGLDSSQTLAVGATAGFQIRFTPSETGSRGAVFEFLTNNADFLPFKVRLRGNGVFPSMQVLGRRQSNQNYQQIANGSTVPSPTKGTEFSVLRVAASRAHDFRIFNAGHGSALRLQEPVLSGSGAERFSIEEADFGTPILGSGNMEFVIRFTPLIRGRLETATIAIPNNDPDEDPFVFTLQGVGEGPEIAVSGNGSAGGFAPISSGSSTPAPLNATDFGAASVGSTVTQQFRIRNRGSEDLFVFHNQVSIGGPGAAHYSISSLPEDEPGISIIGPDNQFILFTISYNPFNAGTHDATVSIGNDDLDESPFTFATTGRTIGLPAEPNIGVVGINDLGKEIEIMDGDVFPDQEVTQFGSAVLGERVTRTYRVTNTGDADLEISSAKSTLDDFVIDGLSASIKAGETDDFTITLTAEKIGERETMITIISNDPDGEGTYTFNLVGEGIGPASEGAASIEHFEIVGGKGNFTLQLPRGRSYRLTYSTRLKPPWATAPGAGNLAGSESPVSVSFGDITTIDGALSAPAPQLFFRIEENP
ncbi:MAG: choice-of-anchor D domain-containing protein, partial [Verrucomicrobiota bacterium]